jgi:hypothetical protein
MMMEASSSNEGQAGPKVALMSRDQTSIAIRNNVAWCDAVCRAYGQPGEFLDSAWVNRGRPPKLYPNIIAIRDGSAPMRHVEELLGDDFSGEWGVKDSYAALPLGRLDFTLLFEGSWIWREPTGQPSGLAGRSDWQCVHDVQALAAWEQAWSQDSSKGGSATFQAGLLNEPGVLFLSHVSADGTVGGLIANETEGVVGISNRFGSATREADLASALELVESHFPGLPLVGYESDDDLGLVEGVGFERVGRLCVWVRG